MIVIGVDVHKQSLTAVALDQAGLMLDERTAAVTARQIGPDRRARCCPSRVARTAAEPTSPRRAALSGADAPGRSPGRPRRRAAPDPAAAALAPAPTRPGVRRPRERTRPTRTP